MHNADDAQWYTETEQRLDTLYQETPTKYQADFPHAPSFPDSTEWENWAVTCSQELEKLRREKRQLQTELEKKNSEASRQKVQQDYMTNQKKINKQILGKTNSHQITALKESLTNDIITDPNKLKQLTHNYFQNQATPADGNEKTGRFLPSTSC